MDLAFVPLFADSGWSSYEIWTMGVRFLAFISTTIIAFIAIWPQLKLSWYPPTLRISLRSDRTRREEFDGGTRCVHIVVENPNRNVKSVDNVILYITKMIVIGDNGHRSVFDTGRIPLKWQINDCI